jgi:hypothetical protein
MSNIFLATEAVHKQLAVQPAGKHFSAGFDSRHYQIFWEVVGLEQGPLSLVSIAEELLERKSSSGLDCQE